MNEVYFDGEKARQIIIERLGRANHSIVLAMFQLNDEKIIEQLNNKAENLQVKVILDDNNFNRKSLDKYSSKISIHFWKGIGLQIMHHKFCLIDDEILLHGTRNYTYNAIQSAEDLKLTDSTELIDDYQKEIENLYSDERTSEYVRGEYDMGQSSPAGGVNVSEEKENYIDKFAEEMQTTVTQIFDEYDVDKIRELGYKDAKENQGNINSYKTYLINVFNDVSGRLTRDDYRRQIVLARMEAVMNRYTENVNEQKRIQIDYANDEKEAFINQNEAIIEEKRRLISDQVEKRNDTDESYKMKELACDHKKQDIASIAKEVIVRKFWDLPSVGTIFMLIFISGLLSFYFSSAIWKIFYEEGYILERLNNEDYIFSAVELVDFTAAEKLWYYMSPGHAVLGQVFFILILFLVNVKYLFGFNKIVGMIISDIIGLLVFDVIVAFVVSKQIGNVEAIISGNDFTWSVLTALSDPFLYFIFVFGAFPLMGSKFCVRYLVNRYKNSKDYLVDKEKAFQKKELEKDLRILESDLVKIENTMTKIDAQIHNVESDITGIKESIVKKQGIFASNLLDIKRNWDGRLGNLQRIFDGFRTSVEAGDKQLLKNLIEGRAAVYKSGWMRFLNEYFAQEQVNLRVKEMDLWQVQWENENFGEL